MPPYTFHRIGNEFSILVENELKSVFLLLIQMKFLSVFAVRLCVHNMGQKQNSFIYFLFGQNIAMLLKKGIN